MWTSLAVTVPLSPGDSEDENAEGEGLLWAKAASSELWWNVVYSYSDDGWVPFFEKPGKPKSKATAAPSLEVWRLIGSGAPKRREQIVLVSTGGF
jgi:hypothetical protein